MAEKILHGFVEQLRGKLTEKLAEKVISIVSEEIRLVYDFKTNLNEFQESLSAVKAVLLDASEERRASNRAVEDWLRRLQDIVFDADDLMDDVDYQNLRRIIVKGNVGKETRDLFSHSNPILFRSMTGHKIKKLTERLNRVKEDISLLKLERKDTVEYGHLSNIIIQRGKTSSDVQEFEIIGRDEDKRNVIGSLFGQGDVHVVAIWGFGGLGKTSLAQLVYNDAQVNNHFETKIWLCVSDYEVFDVRFLTKKILTCLTRREVDDLEMEKLQIMLRESLQGRRYLLVLDDMWNTDLQRWDTLRSYLSVGGSGSKILVTTRNRRVATVMGVDSPYALQGLSENQAWDLFSRLAFGEGRNDLVNPQMVEIGRGITRRCKGVPLALRTLGSLMRIRSREWEYWSSLLENDLWISFERDANIIPVLKLSYDHLPIVVGQCFVYCAMFPKDYEFDKETLISLWMAQGYIVGSWGNESLEGIGEQYFNELLFRSFLQSFQNEYSRRQFYEMHDLIHDLAQSIARDSCIAVGEETETPVSKRVQHLFYSRGPGDHLLQGLNGVKGLRTLYNIGGFDGRKLKQFEGLRVLHWSRISITALNSIGKLTHLRYLDISRSPQVEKLPKSVTDLHNLQTLILSHCENLRELPKYMMYLISLRCLMVDGCSRLQGMPMGFGKLTGLRRLSNFKVGKGGIIGIVRYGHGGLNELEGLSLLRGRLIIEGLGNVRIVESESQNVRLWNKRGLKFLTLDFGKCNNRRSDESLLENLQPHSNLEELEVKYYEGERFAKWLPETTNIVTIRLKYCQKLKQIPALDQLPHLKTLHILNLQVLEHISDDHGNSATTFFPSLQEIKIEYCPNWMGWWRTGRPAKLRQFPCLSSLHIESCRKFTSLTEGMPPLSSLKKLLIRDCPQLSERCEKETGEDWACISHIPSIIIDANRI